MGEKGSTGELGLVFESVPALGLMVPYCMLEDHDLQHLLHLIMGELALVDEGCCSGVKGMDAFIGLLAHIQDRLISEVPEVVFGLMVVAIAANTCQRVF